MQRFFHPCHLLAVAALALLCPLVAQAQESALPDVSAPAVSAPAVSAPAIAANFVMSRSDSGNSLAKVASGSGNLIYLGTGVLLPLLEGGPNGKEHALRTADSLLTSSLLTEVLKHVVREKRPDSNDRTSFPSGHATAAFAVATMQSHYHPRQALLWYGGAALISYSRVKLHRHYYRDVLAGAVVGYFTARFELGSSHGLILSPFVKSHSEGSGRGGLSFSKSF